MCGSSVGTGGWASLTGADEGGLEVGGELVVSCGVAGGLAGEVAAVTGAVGLVWVAACDAWVVQALRQRPAPSTATATRRPVDFTGSVCRVVAICRSLPSQAHNFPDRFALLGYVSRAGLLGYVGRAKRAEKRTG
jgi:hypothetical protein